MSITTQQYADRVVRLGAQRGLDLDEADVESSLPVALLHLSRRVAESPMRAHLEKTYSALTLTSGAVGLSAQVDLPYTIKNATHSDGTRITILQPGSTLRDLAYPRNQYTYYGVIEGNTLYVYQGDGTAAADGTVTLVAVFIPAISTVPTQLIPDLVETGLALAQSNAQEV